MNHFLGHLTYLLRTTIFSSAVEGRGTYVLVYTCWGWKLGGLWGSFVSSFGHKEMEFRKNAPVQSLCWAAPWGHQISNFTLQAPMAQGTDPMQSDRFRMLLDSLGILKVSLATYGIAWKVSLLHNVSQLKMLQHSAYSAHLSWDPSGGSRSFCSLPSACKRSANLSISHNTSAEAMLRRYAWKLYFDNTRATTQYYTYILADGHNFLLVNPLRHLLYIYLSIYQSI